MHCGHVKLPVSGPDLGPRYGTLQGPAKVQRLEILRTLGPIMGGEGGATQYLYGNRNF